MTTRGGRDRDVTSAPAASEQCDETWIQARWRVAVADLWDAVERGEAPGSSGRAVVEVSDLRLVLDYIALDAVEGSP